MQLSTNYPFYLIICCVLLAAFFSWFLYRRNSFVNDEGKSHWWVKLLTAFRFLALFILSFLLLEPLFKAFQRHIEKAVVIIAADASESITANKDSAYYRNVFLPSLKKLGEELGDEYQVDYFQFGAKVKEGLPSGYDEKQTDLSGLFEDLFNRYDKQNVGAIVLATDGIYNEGSMPLNAAVRLKAPVISIALGDTNLQRDLKINNVRHNQLAYFGNSFPLLIEAEAVHCLNEHASLTVSKNGKKLFEKKVHFDKKRQFISVELNLEASERGMQHYVVSISRLSGEVSYVNNQYDVFIDVLDGRQKVLVLAQCPHPDLGAMMSAIESNKNYEVSLRFAADVTNLNTEAYSLVILHQLPGGSYSIQPLLEQLRNKQTATLFVAGSQSNIQALNAAGCGYTINGYRNTLNDALASVNPNFGLFTLEENITSSLAKFPPLKSPFGNYSAQGENEVLLRQQIGSVSTEIPLISFHSEAGFRSGTVFGEGLWRWRLADYQQHQNNEVFNELWSKIVQYLALKEDKRVFRVHSDKKYFSENEHVVFDAELYNQSYELVNDADVQIKITNSKGRTYAYTFSKINKSYILDAGVLPPGTYSYSATVTRSGKAETATGSFMVKPLVLELIHTRADHQLLEELAEESGGKVFSPSAMKQLKDFIASSESIKPVVYRQEEVIDLIHLKWVFALILSLLSLEWFVRKRNGGY